MTAEAVTQDLWELESDGDILCELQMDLTKDTVEGYPVEVFTSSTADGRHCWCHLSQATGSPTMRLNHQAQNGTHLVSSFEDDWPSLLMGSEESVTGNGSPAWRYALHAQYQWVFGEVPGMPSRASCNAQPYHAELTAVPNCSSFWSSGTVGNGTSLSLLGQRCHLPIGTFISPLATSAMRHSLESSAYRTQQPTAITDDGHGSSASRC
jgi:hypothetical protein